MSSKKKYILIFIMLIGFIFGIGNVNAVSGKLMTSYDHCGYKTTSTYVKYGVISGYSSKYSSANAGHQINAYYATIDGTKQHVYCIEKGPDLSIGKTVTYKKMVISSKTVNTDYAISTSSSVKAYNYGSLARLIAYGKHGKYASACSKSSDRSIIVASQTMAHMIGKCIVDNTASVCTSKNSSTGSWSYRTPANFEKLIKSAISGSPSSIASKAKSIRNEMLQHGLRPSFTYDKKSDAQKNARVLSTIDTTNKKFSTSVTDGKKARDGVVTLKSGLWSVSAYDTGLSYKMDGAKITVSTTKKYLGKTLCLTLKKQEKEGTLYINTDGQNTAYLLNPKNRNVYAYVCFKTNYLKVAKVDSVSNTALNGASFKVYKTEANCKVNSNPVKTGKTNGSSNAAQTSGDVYGDAKGNTYFYNLDDSVSNYWVGEISPPSGYKTLPESEKCKKVALNNSTGITFKNDKIKGIQVKKIDSYTNEPIKGVIFGLYDDNKCETPTTELATSTERYQKETDEYGVVEWNIGYTGKKFYVKEETLPQGFISASDTNCYEVEASENTSKNAIVVYNQPFGNIRVLKKDSKTNKPISGVKFRLLDNEQKPAKDKDGNALPVSVTDKNGIALFNNVLYGTYYVEEVAAAAKYKVIEEPIKFILNKNTDYEVLKSNGELTFTHGDIVADGNIDSYDLDALNLLLTSEDGTLGLDKAMIYAADINADGTIDSTDKKILETYILYNSETDGEDIIDSAASYDKVKENVCKLMGYGESCNTSSLSLDRLDLLYKNYDLSNKTAKDNDVDLSQYEQVSQTEWYMDDVPVNNPTEGYCTDDSNLRFSFLGDVSGDCVINQVDVTLLTELVNNGTKDPKATNAGDINGDGLLTTKDVDILSLFVGKKDNTDLKKAVSMFVEAEAIFGKDSNKSVYKYMAQIGKTGVVPSDEAKSSIIIFNEKIDIKISKQDITNQKEVPGAKIVIKNEKGKVITSFTSKKTPKSFYIATGKYTLTETVAPSGYTKLNTIIKFNVGKDGNVKLLSAKSKNYELVNSEGEDIDLDHLIIYNTKVKTIKAKDTASNVKTVFIILGAVLIAGAGYVVYTRYRV